MARSSLDVVCANVRAYLGRSAPSRRRVSSPHDAFTTSPVGEHPLSGCLAAYGHRPTRGPQFARVGRCPLTDTPLRCPHDVACRSMVSPAVVGACRSIHRASRDRAGGRDHDPSLGSAYRSMRRRRPSLATQYRPWWFSRLKATQGCGGPPTTLYGNRSWLGGGDFGVHASVFRTHRSGWCRTCRATSGSARLMRFATRSVGLPMRGSRELTLRMET